MDTVMPARGEVFPLVVLGYSVTRTDRWQQVATTQPIYVFNHQFGGYACLHTSMVGIVLRLIDNLDRASRDPRGLIDALRSMGELGEPLFGVRYPEADRLLNGWYETHGDESTAADVRELDELWQHHFAGFPRAVTGYEALVESEVISDPSYFADWITTRFIASSGTEVDFGDTGCLPRFEIGPHCAEVLPELLALSAGELTAFLLWENSD